MVERSKEYVQAARVIGIPPLLIMLRHVLPNVIGPVLVIATINLAIAVITEATLSFLGIGVPATSPSLGTLVRVGNDFLFSGSWWITIFPGAALAILVLAVNQIGRAHVWTPVTNAHLVCRLLLEKKKKELTKNIRQSTKS